MKAVFDNRDDTVESDRKQLRDAFRRKITCRTSQARKAAKQRIQRATLPAEPTFLGSSETSANVRIGFIQDSRLADSWESTSDHDATCSVRARESLNSSSSTSAAELKTRTSAANSTLTSRKRCNNQGAPAEEQFDFSSDTDSYTYDSDSAREQELEQRYSKRVKRR